MKIRIGFFLFVLMTFSISVYAENWIRSGNLVEKEWNGNKPLVLGLLRSPPVNNNDCSGDDLAVEFDISVFARLAGASFDANRIYVDGVAEGEIALDIWLTDWQRRGYGRRLVALGDSPYDWRNRNKVSVCVGSLVQTAVIISNGLTLDSLESIVLWYDGPVSTTKIPFPSSAGDSMDMSDEADALAVSGNGNKVADFNGSGISTTATENPDPGKPDFIVNRSWLETVGGVEQYVFSKNEEIKMKAQFKNIGDGEIPNDATIHSRAYLSRGYKEDSHNEWIRVGTDETRGDSLDVGETHTETEGLRLWERPEIIPGKTYNIVWCIDRIADQYNGSGDWLERHESNNCSTETVFTVSGSFDFHMTSLSIVGGQTSLFPGSVFSVEASAYNAGGGAPRDIRIGHYLRNETTQESVLIGTNLIKEGDFLSGVSRVVVLNDAPVPLQTGTHTLLSCADYDDRVQEINEADNCFSVPVIVAENSSPREPVKKVSPAVLYMLLGD